MPAHKKSVDEHKEEGTYRPDRHAEEIQGEDLPAVNDYDEAFPPPPDWLSEEATKEYIRMGEAVQKMRIVTVTDKHMLIQYAILYDKMYEAHRPRTDDEPNPPKFSSADHAQLRHTGNELGSGAISRSRIRVHKKKKDKSAKPKAPVLGKASGWGDV